MKVRPTILVKNKKTGEKGRYRMDPQRILIGRESSSFIALEGKTVSREHAEILQEGDHFFLKDLGSENKTFLNDLPLESGEKTLLKSGDVIRVGHHELFFQPSRGEGGQNFYEETDSDILEMKMVKKLLKALDHENVPSLEIVEGPETGKRFLLEGKNQEITIGRDDSCQFRIDSDVISRKHARVLRKWDAVLVEDLGSRNGTYVGEERVRRKALKDGDQVHLGTVVLIFRNPQELSFELNLKKELKKKKEKTPEVKEEKEPPPPEAPESTPSQEKHPFPFSPSDFFLALLGLAVLIGAIWGILKIL